MPWLALLERLDYFHVNLRGNPALFSELVLYQEHIIIHLHRILWINSKANFYLVFAIDYNINSSKKAIWIVVLVHGNFTAWSRWTPCSVSCGGANQTRHRNCTNPVPKHDGNDCSGSIDQRQECNTHHCPSKVLIFLVLFIK